MASSYPGGLDSLASEADLSPPIRMNDVSFNGPKVVGDIGDAVEALQLQSNVFTTEAARDAVVTSPYEGQQAYLTAPTVPAATGETTHAPSGIRTIYNGSVWVCVTPVAAYTAEDANTTSTSYTASLSGDTTNVSVTLTTGTTALVAWTCQQFNQTVNYLTFAAVAVSGATTRAASDTESSISGSGAFGTETHGRTIMLGGLTAGSNTFTLQYRASAGTARFVHRSLTVAGVS